MNYFSRIIFVLAAFCMMQAVHADTINTSGEIDQRDIEALREWVNTKRQVTVNEKGGALAISGEVRAEMQSTGETSNGVKQRGSGGGIGTPLPTNSYDVEVNVMMDYRTDRTWASLKLEFDNDAGIFGGTKNKVKLERAWLGGRIVAQDIYTVDAEIGRRGLNSIYDSKLEGDVLYDGFILRYDHGFQNVGDFYIHAGSFIIDEKRNQYGYVAETGLLNIANSGVYLKFLAIDWDTKHFDEKTELDKRKRYRFQFVPLQMVLGYRFLPKPLNKVVTIYTSGIYNPVARGHSFTNGKKVNYAGYVGVIIGELRKSQDWSFEASYQLVAPQAIPDFDVAGIGIGNAPGAGFYTTALDGTGFATTSANAAGNGNYRGFSLSLDYLITNNLTLQQKWQQSITLDTSIGPFRRYKQYEMELIYGF